MATRTQFQVETHPGCIHEQVCEAVYQQQHRRIQSLCQWMTADANRARELTFRVFVEAWCHPEQVWPAVSGDHLAESFANRFRWLFHSDAAPESPHGEDAGSEPVQGPRLLSGSMPQQPVRSAIYALPMAHRLLYLLHELEGYSAETLAGWLDLDDHYCARLIHQARLELRRQLRAA